MTTIPKSFLEFDNFQNVAGMTPPTRHPAFSPMAPGGGADSMSKILPTVPDMDTQIALAAKMIDKRTSTPKASLAACATGSSLFI